MIPFDEIAPNFLKAKERWSTAPTLSNHYSAIVAKYNENDFGLLEAAKSFIECVCLTVLGEFGKTIASETPTTSELLVETLRTLGLYNSPGAGELGKILKAHNKLAESLNNMRNGHGPIAHGKDGFVDCLSSNQQRTFLLTADTILCIVIAALEGTEPDLQFTREPYERFYHLNERIDNTIRVSVDVDDENDSNTIILKLWANNLPKEESLELRVELSQLLYCLDRSAYIELLKASSSAPLELITIHNEEVQEPAINVQYNVDLQVNFEGNYEGVLADYQDDLREHLISMGLAEPFPILSNTKLVDSLLSTAEQNMGVDWLERNMLQAKMKIEFRRILVQFGMKQNDADRFSDNLVAWFKIQSAESE